MAGTGLKPKHYKKPQVDVWPEAWPALDLFRSRLSTQWRCGGGGPVGLDYLVAFDHLDRIGLEGEDRDDFMGLIGVIEAAALGKMHEK